MNKKKDDRATVKAARINSWGIIIAAVVTLIGGIAIYILQKTESPVTSKKENATGTSNKEDFQLKEIDLVPEPKKIERSLDDKAEINSKSEERKSIPKRETEPKQKDKESALAPATTHVDKIENNGNLSIGQTGGTVNQTIIINPKPQPRHMTEKIVKTLKDIIPTGYVVDVNHPMTDEESINFALEMLTELNRSGYKTTRSAYGQIVPDLNQSHYVNLKHEVQKVEITVYKLK